MKKRGIEKFIFVLILSIFLLSQISAVPVGTCDIVARTACTGNTDNIVMGLSSWTNAHGGFPDTKTYDYVLCCGFGIGTTSCGISASNKIIGLSSATNAHAQTPELATYGTNVCYEDLVCEQKTTCLANQIGILSLSSTTNAHIGKFNDYATKICCRGDSINKRACSLKSAEWGTIEAIEGASASLIVQGSGTECSGTMVSFKVRKVGFLGLDSDAYNQPSSVAFIGATATGTWLITNTKVGDTYYFKANTSRDSIDRSGNNLNIIDSDICSSITSCNDYLIESDCGSDSTICNVVTNEVESIYGACSEKGTSCSCIWDNTKLVGKKCSASITIIPTDTTYCHDGIVTSLNDVGMDEQCDPDAGTNSFLPESNTCLKLTTNLKMNNFIGGILGCKSDCSFDITECTTSTTPTCGDNVINQLTEDCDTSDLGGKSCSTLGFSGGVLSCKSDCTFNKNLCIPETTTYCGNGIIEINNANFNEQCDPSDGPGITTPIKFKENKDRCINFDSFTGGALKCSSSCTLKYQSCTGGTNPTCGNNIVDQLKESCDKEDMQGLTCKYLGYDEGELTCSTSCKADSTTCTVTEQTEYGTCTITQSIDKDCDTEPVGYKTITWSGAWVGTTTGTARDKCLAGGTITVPCPAQIQLPFFDFIQIVGSLIVVALIYASSIIRKRKK